MHHATGSFEVKITPEAQPPAPPVNAAARGFGRRAPGITPALLPLVTDEDEPASVASVPSPIAEEITTSCKLVFNPSQWKEYPA